MTKDEVISKLKSIEGAKSYSDEGDKYMYVYEVGPVRFKYDGSPVYFGTRDQAYAAWAVLTDEERETLKEIGSGPVPPFDWSTVNPGMAFKSPSESIIHFIGPHLKWPKYAYFVTIGDPPVLFEKSELTRHPEADIEVPK